MTGQSARHVAVIGAGIVGVSCATYLQRHGAQVTLIDRLAPGEACSFGNAGSLSPSSCVPIAVPGLLRKVPGWLLRNDGPLTIRWAYLPRLLPWLIRFVRAGNLKQLQAACDALSDLHSPSLELHRDMAAQAGASALISDCDFLHVYSSEQNYRDSRLQWDLRAEHGATLEVLDAADLHALEPDLSQHYKKAVLAKHQGYTTNPSKLVKLLANAAVERGATLLQDSVAAIEHQNGGVRRLRLDSESLDVDAVVVAAGAWSLKLLRPLGIDIPLEAERGYHVTMNEPNVQFSRTIMETDAMMVATPMEMGARFAGTVELAEVDAPANYARADSIEKAAQRMFPNLETKPQTRWMGCRPSLPDGLPVIDRAPGFDNLFMAFGNAHTGMVGGPNTGRIAAGMVCQQPVNMDVQPFRADRF